MRPLLEQLSLTPLAEGFEGPASLESHIRTFGGQTIAQSLVAAGLTVSDDRACHSLHGYFLRPGSTDKPATFAVDQVRDGRSFAMREVTVLQNDKSIFRLMGSFHRSEQSAEHTAPMPSVAPPEALARFDERFGGREDMVRWFDRVSSFDVRFAADSPFDADFTNDTHKSQVWFRFAEGDPGSQLMHQAVVAYISDLAILDPILLAHKRRWTDSAIIGASLDHAMWFHRPIDATKWLLFDQTSSVSAGSRGLAKAEVWTEDGQLVATVCQEALLRPPHSKVPSK